MNSRRIVGSLLVGIGIGAALSAGTGAAHAQGCIVGRSCSSGAISDSQYLMPGQLDFSVDYRGFRASRHFNGDVQQVQRETLGNFVINRQNIWNGIVAFGLTRQLSLSVDVPYVNSSWSIPLPTGSAAGTTRGPRYEQTSTGIGDVSVQAKYWIFDTHRHTSGNVAVGLGIKAPTGNDNVKHAFPTLSGTNIENRTVDQSIQPGDGGWGIPLSLEGFRRVGPVNFFGNGSYLISPRDTNGVPSILATLGVAAPATAPSELVNSVPDQYLVRFGVGASIPKVQGLSVALAWRREGVPAHDLIGGHHGWRRPGYSTSLEPGITYVRRGTTYNFSMPITNYRNRVPTDADGVKVAGDSTFADKQFIFSIAKRYDFGKIVK